VSQTQARSIHEIELPMLNGKEASLSAYAGNVVLVVNVASKCGYTKQYTGMEALYEKYKDKGFVLIGVPANNFGGQEPGNESQIKEFCSSKFHVTFPMTSKVSIKGADICPLYKHLTTQAKETGDVSWNFEKFLINKNGEIVGRYKSKVTPEDKDLVAAIEAELAK
jgi:glutathione peroxidase